MFIANNINKYYLNLSIILIQVTCDKANVAKVKKCCRICYSRHQRYPLLFFYPNVSFDVCLDLRRRYIWFFKDAVKKTQPLI